MNEFSETRPEPSDANAIAGEFVTETFDYDDGRQVMVYVPPVRPEAIVFVGDGQLISPWGRLLEGADVPSTMIVGVHCIDDETLRLHEYSPKFDPKRFAAHEKFFVEDVGSWTFTFRRIAPLRAHGRVWCFGERRTRTSTGASASGTLRRDFLSLARPGYRLPDAMLSRLPRTYLVASTREPFFLENAARWAAAFARCTELVMSERPAGHDDEMWRREFPLMIRWAFSRTGET